MRQPVFVFLIVCLLFQDVYAAANERLRNHMRDLCVRWSFWGRFTNVNQVRRSF